MTDEQQLSKELDAHYLALMLDGRSTPEQMTRDMRVVGMTFEAMSKPPRECEENTNAGG